MLMWGFIKKYEGMICAALCVCILLGSYASVKYKSVSIFNTRNPYELKKTPVGMIIVCKNNREQLWQLFCTSKWSSHPVWRPVMAVICSEVLVGEDNPARSHPVIRDESIIYSVVNGENVEVPVELIEFFDRNYSPMRQ